jgi:CO/xanthine dehydrogenase Mo-binding subunit
VISEIGNLLYGGEPTLAVGERICWHVPVLLAYPDSGPVGQVGILDVDVETGVVRVTRLATILAGGPFTDSRPPEGHVQGALAEALEQALAGGLPFDAEGRPRVRSLRRWPLVAAVDVPPLSVTFVPGGEPLSRFGATALGEAAARAALAAIVNAVSQATGARLRELPLSPPRVLDAVTTRGER